jgi:hypothetical protein
MIQLVMVVMVLSCGRFNPFGLIDRLIRVREALGMTPL